MSEVAITPKPKKSVALSGVVAGNTALCTVGRTGNDLHYRGYDILDMADVCEFEEIAYLLVHEKLPNEAELAAYKARLKSLRGLPASLSLPRVRWRAPATRPSQSGPRPAGWRTPSSRRPPRPASRGRR